MTRCLCGIDPGLAAGGAVILSLEDNEAILDVYNMRSKPDKKTVVVGDSQFTDAIQRARKIVEPLSEWIDSWKPEHIGIESFVDLGSRARKFSNAGQVQFNINRWMTPLLIGMLDPALKDYKLIYQNPAILRSFKQEITQINQANSDNKKRDDVLNKGDRLLSNDHLVKAWCHVSWLQMQLAKPNPSL
jgi:hypothetical protein